MDLSWLGQEIVAHWIALAVTFVGLAVLGFVKKHWSSTATPVLYGLIGVVIVIFWISLQHQSAQQADKLETLADEQVEALERLAREQVMALSELARTQPTRPYFTQTQGIMLNIEGNRGHLAVSVQNNGVPAVNVVSHLLVLEENLNPNAGPLYSSKQENANPIGPSGTYSHRWRSVNVPPNSRPAFVVFQMQYSHAISEETFSQALFLMFLGSSDDGSFEEELYHASNDQKMKILRYMEQRGISTL